MRVFQINFYIVDIGCIGNNCILLEVGKFDIRSIAFTNTIGNKFGVRYTLGRLDFQSFVGNLDYRFLHYTWVAHNDFLAVTYANITSRRVVVSSSKTMRYPYAQRNLLLAAIMTINLEQNIVAHSSCGLISYCRSVACYMCMTIVTVYIPLIGNVNIVMNVRFLLCFKSQYLALANIELLNTESVGATI